MNSGGFEPIIFDVSQQFFLLNLGAFRSIIFDAINNFSHQYHVHAYTIESSCMIMWDRLK